MTMYLLTPAGLFGFTSQLMGPLWLLLILSLFVHRLQPTAQWIARFGLPVLFGSLYAAALLPQVPFESGGFGSLEDLRELFANDWLLLAGWVHYLVFDFFVGAWIARDSRTAGVPRLLIIPCLIACLLAGPIGLLAYLILRGAGMAVRRRQPA